jgi:hypothetical protein
MSRKNWSMARQQQRLLSLAGRNSWHSIMSRSFRATSIENTLLFPSAAFAKVFDRERRRGHFSHKLLHSIPPSDFWNEFVHYRQYDEILLLLVINVCSRLLKDCDQRRSGQTPRQQARITRLDSSFGVRD